MYSGLQKSVTRVKPLTLSFNINNVCVTIPIYSEVVPVLKRLLR